MKDATAEDNRPQGAQEATSAFKTILLVFLPFFQTLLIAWGEERVSEEPAVAAAAGTGLHCSAQEHRISPSRVCGGFVHPTRCMAHAVCADPTPIQAGLLPSSQCRVTFSLVFWKKQAWEVSSLGITETFCLQTQILIPLMHSSWACANSCPSTVPSASAGWKNNTPS